MGRLGLGRVPHSLLSVALGDARHHTSRAAIGRSARAWFGRARCGALGLMRSATMPRVLLHEASDARLQNPTRSRSGRLPARARTPGDLGPSPQRGVTSTITRTSAAVWLERPRVDFCPSQILRRANSQRRKFTAARISAVTRLLRGVRLDRPFCATPAGAVASRAVSIRIINEDSYLTMNTSGI